MVKSPRFPAWTVPLILLLSSCAFLTSDIFPSWLSYADSSVDLRGLVNDLSGGTTVEPGNVYAEYLRVPGGDAYIAVLYYEGPQWRLILLDSGDMSLITSFTSDYYSPLLGAGAGGGILCGQRIIDTAALTDAPGPISGLGYGYRQWNLRNQAGALNYVIGTDGASLSEYVYDGAWTYQADYYSPIGDGSLYPTDGWELLDGETDSAGEGSYLLFRYYGGAYGVGYAAHYASTAGMLGHPILDTAAEVTGPFPANEGRAWITYGGPVAFVYGDKGEDRLVRYAFGTGDSASGVTSTELDSLSLDSDNLDILSFDPEGSFWLVYDRLSGRLFKLRTWWQ